MALKMALKMAVQGLSQSSHTIIELRSPIYRQPIKVEVAVRPVSIFMPNNP